MAAVSSYSSSSSSLQSFDSKKTTTIADVESTLTKISESLLSDSDFLRNTTCSSDCFYCPYVFRKIDHKFTYHRLLLTTLDQKRRSWFQRQITICDKIDKSSPKKSGASRERILDYNLKLLSIFSSLRRNIIKGTELLRTTRLSKLPIYFGDRTEKDSTASFKSLDQEIEEVSSSLNEDIEKLKNPNLEPSRTKALLFSQKFAIYDIEIEKFEQLCKIWSKNSQFPSDEEKTKLELDISQLKKTASRAKDLNTKYYEKVYHVALSNSMSHERINSLISEGKARDGFS